MANAYSLALGRGRAGERVVLAAGSGSAGSTSCAWSASRSGPRCAGSRGTSTASSPSACCRPSPAGSCRSSRCRCSTGSCRRSGSAPRWACTGWASSSRPAIGPTLGGYLVEYVDWRLIFFINVPVGILGIDRRGGLAAAVRAEPRGAVRRARLRRHRDRRCSRLLLALTEGADLGLDVLPDAHPVRRRRALRWRCSWSSSWRSTQPLLDVRVFRHWAFTNSLMLIAVLSVGLFARAVLHPAASCSRPRGWARSTPGLLLLPQALVMAVIMPVGRDDLRPVRPALARRDRAGARPRGHLPADRRQPRHQQHHDRLAARAARRRAWAWR